MFSRGRTDSTTAYADLLVVGAQWLLLVCAAWATVLVAAATLEVLTRGRLAATTWVGAPPRLRRALLTAVGLVLVSVPGIAGATTASPGGARLPVPERPTGVLAPHPRASAAPAGRPATEQHHGRSLVVGPGDTLWGLASDALGSAAPAHDVAALVSRLHARNRAVIGPDADLIRPGQRLVVPPLPHRRSPDHPAPEETP